jgi:hypothetical protein
MQSNEDWAVGCMHYLEIVKVVRLFCTMVWDLPSSISGIEFHFCVKEIDLRAKASPALNMPCRPV